MIPSPPASQSIVRTDEEQFLSSLRARLGGSFPTWDPDGKMKAAAFAPVAARYVRLDAMAVNGTNAAATEISVGAQSPRVP